MPPAAPAATAVASAWVHVNSDSSLLDEGLRLHSTRRDGTQRHGFRGSRHNGQADSGDGSTTYDSREHAAAINYFHWSAPH